MSLAARCVSVCACVFVFFAANFCVALQPRLKVHIMHLLAGELTVSPLAEPSRPGAAPRCAARLGTLALAEPRSRRLQTRLPVSGRVGNRVGFGGSGSGSPLALL